MTFYHVYFDESFGFVTTQRDSDIKILRKQLSNAIVVGNDLHKIQLEIGKESRKNELADFPAFYSGGILATENAKNTIKELIGGCGQWVNMEFEANQLFYFNTTLKLDALDEDRSDISSFDGYVTGIKHYQLKDDDYTTSPIFKFGAYPSLPPVVTQQFVDVINQSGLTGLIFKPLP